MPPTKTIKLILAAIIVTGLVVIIGATVRSGTTAAIDPITRQILRRKDRSTLPASLGEIELLRRKAQDQEKRILKIREFKDMPLKIHAIRNVESEKWYKDLQIEVTNIAAKPIYCILAYLEFPDHKPFNRDTGIDLTFGEPKYYDIEVLADPQDLHLDPGQTYVFTIPEKVAKVLGKQHERKPEEFKKLDFHFTIISFGDGTGFQAGRALDLRKTKPPEGADYKRHHGNKSSYSTTRSPPQDGCGSCGQYTLKSLLTCFDVYINDWCAPSPTIQVRTSGPCQRYRTLYWDCDGDEFPECPKDDIYDSESCPGYTPPPSPTPTPASTPTPQPTCDPATKPNDSNCNCEQSITGGSPQWSCACVYTDSGSLWSGIGANYHTYPGPQGYGGCGANRINNGVDCCVCAVTTCPEGSTLNRDTCQCETGGGGDAGSGGGGTSDPPLLTYKRECVDYVWVHFISYDGGQTWHYDDREEYAGCYYVY